MNNARLYLAIILCLWALPSLAQESNNSFSLEEAKVYAKHHSYDVREKDLDVTIARKEVWRTIAIGLPQVDGNASYEKNLDLAVSLVPGEFFGEPAGTFIPVQFGQKYTSSFGFSVSQLIFDGSYIVGLESASIYVQLAKDAKEKTQIEIADYVAQAYFAVLVAETTHSVMQDNLENTQKLLRETREYYKNGLIEEQDVDQLVLLEKKAKNEVLKAQRQEKVSRAVLKYTMGIPIENTITLTDKLDLLIKLAISGESDEDVFNPSNHIDSKIQHTQVAVQEKLLKLEYTSMLPRIEGFYNWNKMAYNNSANLFKRSVGWYPSSSIGVKVNMKICSWGQRLMKIQEAKLKLEQEMIKQNKTFEKLQQDFITAKTEYTTAIEEYNNSKENEQLAKKIYGKMQVKFNNGLSTSIELSQSESQYIEAHSSYIASCMQLLNTQTKLDKILSRL